MSSGGLVHPGAGKAQCIHNRCGVGVRKSACARASPAASRPMASVSPVSELVSTLSSLDAMMRMSAGTRSPRPRRTTSPSTSCVEQGSAQDREWRWDYRGSCSVE